MYPTSTVSLAKALLVIDRLQSVGGLREVVIPQTAVFQQAIVVRQPGDAASYLGGRVTL